MSSHAWFGLQIAAIVSGFFSLLFCPWWTFIICALVSFVCLAIRESIKEDERLN